MSDRSRSMVLAALLLAAAPARAAAVKVAVLPISGSDGALEATIARALHATDQVPPSDWDAAAKRLVATSRSADDIAAVARELGVQVVVTGSIKHDDTGWVLVIAVRNGPTGKRADRLSFPLSSEQVDQPTQQRAAAEVARSVQRVAAAPPATSDGGEGDDKATPAPAPAPAAAPAPTPAPAPAPASTATAASVVAAAPERPSARPPWAPYFDVSVGTIVSGRGLTFDGATQPFFASTIAEGLHFDATGYPLAGRAAAGGRGNGALSGLGLGVTVDGVFWPDAVPCVKDAGGACMSGAQRFGVRELRVEGGVRWKWNVFMAPDTLEILASAQYGQHALTIDKRPDGSDLGPPDVSYSYVTLGVGARVPFAHFIAAVARFNYHALIGAGPITAASEYGPGGGTGLRAGGGLEITLWEGLTVHLDGFYERFSLGFDGTGMPDKSAKGAVDQYYGALASLGYVEHRALPKAAPPPPPDADGDGITDAEDQCPKQPGPAATHGCPDGDGDGIADRDDKCPQAAGPAALGGCPDSDKDGVADAEDQCPQVPGDAANHGCPVYKAIKVTAERIELAEKIFFAYDKVEIQPKSHEILDEVVQALADHPALRVKILGHTDSSGNEKHNLELSEGRASAVRDYLVSHGIDAARIVEAHGFGSQYPIDSNKTLEGRENNRRVEFLIVRDEKPAQ